MTETTSPKRARWLYGCGGLAIGAMVAPIVLYGGWSWYAAQQEARLLVEQRAKAESVFEPAVDKLKEAEQAETYDIDATVRVIHGIDKALEEQEDLEGYLRVLARQDYTGVAPEVLASRSEILGVIQELYATQTRAEDQQALWEMTSELLLSTLSVVSVQGAADPLAPSASFSVDREQAKEILTDMKERQADHARLVQEVDRLERELFDALVGYSDVYWKYVREWDALGVVRDRAYLASYGEDWGAAAAAAEQAIAMAPSEREAHLILAWALIEEGNPETISKVDAMLAEQIEQHPQHTAPALLLLGVNRARAGDSRGARLSLQQAAAYYPKQADALLDMLDPYKMRSFLRKSREGSYILELYEGTMLGSGYFSPDLQLARLAFDAGDFEQGKGKVLDHFARRRTQEQYDFILSDIAFCHDLLGPQFWEIFPENTWLDLEVSPTMLGGGLNLAIVNRSERVLHNATLVLALHLTDMYPDDYTALRVPETAPAILPHDTTSFGSVTIELELDGKPKGVNDIVHHRAILIADEAVTWVDTDAFKVAEASEFRQKRGMGAAMEKDVEHPSVTRHPEFRRTVDRLASSAASEAAFALDAGWGNDDVLVEIPRELSLLRPVFRLKYGDELYTAADNVIEGDRIKLRFKGVDNFDEGVRSDDLELLVGSPFGDLVVTWKADGQIAWRLQQ
ncbi:MAG: hypothetical protein ACI8PZ_006065 [Myxococcota bacterium]|jgi:hypothetical protein